ncbi:hypothetical protein C8R44DRAFT_747470 [Mycena epipterygia]|nr:hypothetical protein C8R44DRAFT_747470 [Mycena epipterygia]
MSLKDELKIWTTAADAFNDRDYEGALKLFSWNGRRYFQRGVSHFLLERYRPTSKDFKRAWLSLRGNEEINYEQLGLRFRLFASEVSGILYWPSDKKVTGIVRKDYMGQAILIAATDLEGLCLASVPNESQSERPYDRVLGPAAPAEEPQSPERGRHRVPLISPRRESGMSALPLTARTVRTRSCACRSYVRPRFNGTRRYEYHRAGVFIPRSRMRESFGACPSTGFRVGMGYPAPGVNLEWHG